MAAVLVFFRSDAIDSQGRAPFKDKSGGKVHAASPLQLVSVETIAATVN